MFMNGVPVELNSRVFTGSGNTSFTNESSIVVNKASGAATAVTLPAMTGSPLNSLLTVVDGKGDAATNNITVTAAGSETINGAATYVIKANYGAVKLKWNGTQWNVVSSYQETAISGALAPTSIANSGNLTSGSASADLATVKGVYAIAATSVSVPSIASAGLVAKVDVTIVPTTYAAAVGDAVIAMPAVALPTNCRLLGAWVSAANTVTITFGAETGAVTGAAKNFTFLCIDLT